MQDRFKELMANAPPGPETDEEMGEVGLPTTEDEEPKQFMNDFFEEVNEIKQGMSNIRKNMKDIEECYSQSLVATNTNEQQASSAELERLIDATNFEASKVRNKLKEMDADTKKSDKSDVGTAEWRVRTNMHGSLTRKFLELMAEYQELQTKYKNKYKDRVERQIKIVNPAATDEEIEQVLESGTANEIFAEQILDKRHTQAKDALAYVENRHRDIIKLEQSIQELHRLFLDMAILVEAQGELIDQIEYNVSQSVAYTKDGLSELRKANKLARKSRKKMCCIIVILIIVVVVIAGGAIGGGIAGSKA
eukprot:TRINITY_DN3893_c0_g9_i1.p1 TRINITY_DN3893_c0_g9~~TRINITY_DN3893_c0_g9_i1.p1  ORF type:complete len:307 (-),score=91.99 TRINITY_DN3893_c0_g9_i1:387-1307(-)